jgi:hypothetical protein
LNRQALAKTDAVNRSENWRNAKNWDRKSIDIWSEIQRNRILNKIDRASWQTALSSLIELN